MFNDRDLAILGGGALLAILCLFLPLPFAGRIVIGFLVLVGFMAVALLRLGPDRIPPEAWLLRRFRFARQTHQYVNQQAASSRKRDPQAASGSHPVPAPVSPAAALPVDLAWNEIGIYPVLTVLLGVVGIYFVVWLSQGGAAELALWFQ